MAYALSIGDVVKVENEENFRSAIHLQASNYEDGIGYVEIAN